MTRTTHVAVPARAASLLVAAAFASTGVLALGASSASATPGDPHKVWVCKYVQKPGEDEVLKGGKNPIHVDEAALTNERGVEPQLDDLFSDGQHLSVVVSLEEEPPATECPTAETVEVDAEVIEQTGDLGLEGGIGSAPEPEAETPADVTGDPAAPAPAAPDAAGDPAAAESGTGGVGAVPPPTTVALSAVPVLGDAAPDTGGLGRVAEETGSADLLVGAALVAVAGGLLAAELRRRRRGTAQVD